MQREAILDAWMPAEGAWSLWAKPVLFAQMKTGSEFWLSIPIDWAPPATGKIVLIADLPGEDAVHVGLALASRGYRPVPLFNACTGPGELINQLPITRALQAGAAYLAALSLPASAPPVFLLDSFRSRTPHALAPGMLDNRWKVFPEDFPSAQALQQRGVGHVLLIQMETPWGGGEQPQPDLARVLRTWQEAQITLEAKDILTPGPPQPLIVRPIPWYRRWWYALQARQGLDHSRHDGFGYIVPQSSSG